MSFSSLPIFARQARAVLRVIAVVSAICLLASGAAAQTRSVSVGTVGSGVLALVQSLSQPFQEETGITVTPVPVDSLQNTIPGDLAALVVPDRAIGRFAVKPEAKRHFVFQGDAVLIGSRAERARVKGLRDIETAFRWIASARGTFVSSSEEFGLRELELGLWGRLNINVQTRLNWYVEATGDERRILRNAGDQGAYALVERSTFLSAPDRRGLEILVQGDPRLQTRFSSLLLHPEQEEARIWQEWLLSASGQAAIGQFRINGTAVFDPAVNAAQQQPS